MNGSNFKCVPVLAVACMLAPIAFGDGSGRQIDNAHEADSPRHTTLPPGRVEFDRSEQVKKRLIDLTQYRGTQVGLHPDVSGEVEQLHRQISELFTLQDPAPSPARLAHFSWLDRPDIRINGWYGTILDVVSNGDRLLVKIRVSPYVAMVEAPIASTTAHFIEVYEIKGGVLRFLGGEVPKGGVNLLMTD